MAAMFAVLFVAFIALAHSAPQFPSPYGPQQIPYSGYGPGVYSYDSQYQDPITGFKGAGIPVIPNAPYKPLDVVSGRAAYGRALPPAAYNPIYDTATPYGPTPYNYPSQYYNPQGLGYRGQIGYAEY